MCSSLIRLLGRPTPAHRLICRAGSRDNYISVSFLSHKTFNFPYVGVHTSNIYPVIHRDYPAKLEPRGREQLLSLANVAVLSCSDKMCGWPSQSFIKSDMI